MASDDPTDQEKPNKLQQGPSMLKDDDNDDDALDYDEDVESDGDSEAFPTEPPPHYARTSTPIDKAKPDVPTVPDPQVPSTSGEGSKSSKGSKNKPKPVKSVVSVPPSCDFSCWYCKDTSSRNFDTLYYHVFWHLGDKLRYQCKECNKIRARRWRADMCNEEKHSPCYKAEMGRYPPFLVILDNTLDDIIEVMASRGQTERQVRTKFDEWCSYYDRNLWRVPTQYGNGHLPSVRAGFEDNPAPMMRSPGLWNWMHQRSLPIHYRPRCAPPDPYMSLDEKSNPYDWLFLYDSRFPEKRAARLKALENTCRTTKRPTNVPVRPTGSSAIRDALLKIFREKEKEVGSTLKSVLSSLNFDEDTAPRAAPKKRKAVAEKGDRKKKVKGGKTKTDETVEDMDQGDDTVQDLPADDDVVDDDEGQNVDTKPESTESKTAKSTPTVDTETTAEVHQPGTGASVADTDEWAAVRVRLQRLSVAMAHDRLSAVKDIMGMTGLIQYDPTKPDYVPADVQRSFNELNLSMDEIMSPTGSRSRVLERLRPAVSETVQDRLGPEVSRSTTVQERLGPEVRRSATDRLGPEIEGTTIGQVEPRVQLERLSASQYATSPRRSPRKQGSPRRIPSSQESSVSPPRRSQRLQQQPPTTPLLTGQGSGVPAGWEDLVGHMDSFIQRHSPQDLADISANSPDLTAFESRRMTRSSAKLLSDDLYLSSPGSSRSSSCWPLSRQRTPRASPLVGPQPGAFTKGLAKASQKGKGKALQKGGKGISKDSPPPDTSPNEDDDGEEDEEIVIGKSEKPIVISEDEKGKSDADGKVEDDVIIVDSPQEEKVNEGGDKDKKKRDDSDKKDHDKKNGNKRNDDKNDGDGRDHDKKDDSEKDHENKDNDKKDDKKKDERKKDDKKKDERKKDDKKKDEQKKDDQKKDDQKKDDRKKDDQKKDDKKKDEQKKDDREKDDQKKDDKKKDEQKKDDKKKDEQKKDDRKKDDQKKDDRKKDDQKKDKNKRKDHDKKNDEEDDEGTISKNDSKEDEMKGDKDEVKKTDEKRDLKSYRIPKKDGHRDERPDGRRKSADRYDERRDTKRGYGWDERRNRGGDDYRHPSRGRDSRSSHDSRGNRNFGRQAVDPARPQPRSYGQETTGERRTIHVSPIKETRTVTRHPRGSDEEDMDVEVVPPVVPPVPGTSIKREGDRPQVPTWTNVDPIMHPAPHFPSQYSSYEEWAASTPCVLSPELIAEKYPVTMSALQLFGSKGHLPNNWSCVVMNDDLFSEFCSYLDSKIDRTVRSEDTGFQTDPCLTGVVSRDSKKMVVRVGHPNPEVDAVYRDPPHTLDVRSDNFWKSDFHVETVENRSEKLAAPFEVNDPDDPLPFEEVSYPSEERLSRNARKRLGVAYDQYTINHPALHSKPNKLLKNRVGFFYPSNRAVIRDGFTIFPAMCRESDTIVYIKYPTKMGSEADVLKIYTDFRPYFPKPLDHSLMPETTHAEYPFWCWSYEPRWSNAPSSSRDLDFAPGTSLVE
jgi:hypothetical protein